MLEIMEFLAGATTIIALVAMVVCLIGLILACAKLIFDMFRR